VENPLGLLKIIRRRLAAGGRVLLETHGAADRTFDSAAVHIPAPGEVYAHDDFVYWGFTPAGLDAMARHAGFEGFELLARSPQRVRRRYESRPRISAEDTDIRKLRVSDDDIEVPGFLKD